MADIYKIEFTPEEMNISLKKLRSKIIKILYVYEQSLTNENFHYRPYVYSVVLYASSINYIAQDKIIDIIINLNSLLINVDMNKGEIRKIVLDCKKQIDLIIKE